MTEAKSKPRGAMVAVQCERCQHDFTAREADRKRGWGRFCSKTCKARHRADTDQPPSKDATQP